MPLQLRLPISISILCVQSQSLLASQPQFQPTSASATATVPSKSFSSTACVHLASTTTHALLSSSEAGDEYQWWIRSIGDDWTV
ncbi:hypothetical protein B0H19DRAFT_1258850 [Mycena capillaripes]|nr:hypothetical protein B0H19DRAFT_1258850 [Mycena capillaripes]